MTERPYPKPFFERKDGGFAPSSITGSPWGPNQMNGAAVGALMAQTLLEANPPQGMNIARFTLDILKPAPMELTTVTWRQLRDGRRTIVLEGVLTSGGVEAARASALFVRRADEGAPATVFAPPSPMPEDAPEVFQMPLTTRIESRLLQRGAAGTDQPLGRVWVTPFSEIVAGSPIDPVVCAVIASDFGGGTSSGIQRGAYTSPNVDIAVHFVRPPRDVWVLVEATTLLAGNGSALVQMQLSDRHGLFGHAHQVLAVAPVRAVA